MTEKRKPIDLTLGEVAAMCGSADHEHPDMDTIDFEGPPPMAVAAAFEEIHPAVAGSVLRRIENGLDDGFTIQGAAHPHFQKPLQMALTDDGDRP